MKYKCIYCKQEKEESEFNREHVVPRMMGRYTDGLVLSNYQVCEECNSYFSKEIENKLGLDSLEAFLRMQSGTKPMSDGRALKNTRISIEGANGLLKGLKFHPIADSSKKERIRFDVKSCVGIKLNDEEYEYYSLDNIPVATEKCMAKLKEYDNPIVQFGYSEEEVRKVLTEKGYLKDTDKYYEKTVADEYQGEEFIANINFKVDSIVRRMCAKTVFNFLCWNNTADYMLESRFDALRNYIRYGIWDEETLWFNVSRGYVNVATPPNSTAHVVGTMVHRDKDKWELVGCVTWFGEITYIIKICDLGPIIECKLTDDLDGIVPPQIDTVFLYFDNENTTISEDNSYFIYE